MNLATRIRSGPGFGHVSAQSQGQNGRGWVPYAVVAVVMLVPFRGLWVGAGPPMEEGFMLVFPEQILNGQIPNKDFLHLYGPGSLWVLAGFFKVLGTDIWVERLVGLLQIVGLIGGVTYVSQRIAGRFVAAVAGTVTAVLILPPIGFNALAWVGGLALALWAVIVAVRVFDDDHSSDRTLLYAGLLAGLALLYRPDLILAIGLSLGVLVLWAYDWSQRRRLALGLAAGVSPYLIHIVLAGPGNAIGGMVTEPLFDLREGRRLPFPPNTDKIDSYLGQAFVWRNWPWPFPALSEPKQVFVWAFLLIGVCVGLVAIGLWARRAGSPHGWRLLALGLLCLGILPQAIQRADTTHLDWVSCLPFGLVPAALAEALRLRGATPKLRWAAALTPFVIMFVAIPHYTVRWYADFVGQSFGYRQDSVAITNKGRTFYYGNPDVAAAAQELLRDTNELTESGQRLIVGTGDLSKTAYSEAFLYFLLPQLEPATRYIEMDPGIANAEDSGLDDELRNADVVILSTVYDDWVEPNTSAEPGSAKPNAVLDDDFCPRGTYGLRTTAAGESRAMYELYIKC